MRRTSIAWLSVPCHPPLHPFQNAKSDCRTNLNLQLNYLGHYTLTRLLEGVLVRSKPSRVVSVSSVTSRFCRLRSAVSFLSRPEHASYGETKLAQTMFSFELQRRLGHLGVDVFAPFPPPHTRLQTHPSYWNFIGSRFQMKGKGAHILNVTGEIEEIMGDTRDACCVGKCGGSRRCEVQHLEGQVQ